MGSGLTVTWLLMAHWQHCTGDLLKSSKVYSVPAPFTADALRLKGDIPGYRTRHPRTIGTQAYCGCQGRVGFQGRCPKVCMRDEIWHTVPNRSVKAARDTAG
jgi:hypothetical protein